mgnify:CR=1 FL=1
MGRRRVHNGPAGISTMQMLTRLPGVSYRQFSAWLTNGVFGLTWGPGTVSRAAVILDWEAEAISILVSEIAELDARMTAIRTGARWAELVEQLDATDTTTEATAA